MLYTDLIKSTTSEVMKKSKHVKITTDQSKFDKVVSLVKTSKPDPFFDFDCHIDMSASIEDITSYVFVLDAQNFCFWPTDWEYDNLAQSIKIAHQTNPDYIRPEFLSKVGLDEFKNLFFNNKDFPQLEERHRVVNELGQKTLKYFDGDFNNVIKKNPDANMLLEAQTSFYLLFQDHAIYDGRQVFFYKRAQILIADLHAAYTQKLGVNNLIKNCEELTCFADYRVPQILAQYGIIEYSEELLQCINNGTVMDYGCQMEVELRAAMIQSVEMIAKLSKICAIEVDWLLWQIGEREKNEIVPFHKVYSIYY